MPKYFIFFIEVPSVFIRKTILSYRTVIEAKQYIADNM
jgi:hypothetical protein